MRPLIGKRFAFNELKAALDEVAKPTGSGEDRHSVRHMSDALPPFHPRRHAIARPDDVAFRISTSSESVSFAQLEARANQAAQAFRKLGLRRGDHIVILMENRREFLEICFAADRTGLYYTTASTHLTNEEIRYIIGDCGASLVLVSDVLADRILAFAGEWRINVRSWSLARRMRTAELRRYGGLHACNADRRRIPGPRYALLLRHDRQAERASNGLCQINRSAAHPC